MRKYVISILLTGCISALFGLIFIDNFKVVFAIATLFQFIGFYIFNNIYENLLQRKAIELSIEFEKERSKGMVTVSCPTCGNIQQIQMAINTDKLYECSKCKKEIKASNATNTLLTTNPIYTQG
tara:strand:- start:56505 stop:56876 length:372 start_codon:yes stop_codon:yes gene_type:complete